MSITPVILCGGSGTRLWPSSRPSKPKQFLDFGSGDSLLSRTIQRCGDEVFNQTPVIVGGAEHRFLIAETVQNLESSADILLEPIGRNSCAAIAAACFHVSRATPDGVVLVLAADHHIPDRKAFADAVKSALRDAEDGYLVTFGVKPTHPSTGYGYVLPGQPLKAAFKVSEFVEKPSLGVAEGYLEEGKRVWNSGNFMFKASAFLEELYELERDIYVSVKSAVDNMVVDLDFLRLEKSSFANTKSISVDHAIMERTENAAVLPVEYAWSDIGSWDAMGQMLSSDNAGNSVEGDVVTRSSTNNVIFSDHSLTTVIGMSDTIVVTTRDAVLVADKSHAEEVKLLVADLLKSGRQEATDTLKVFRPWGAYEQLDISEHFQVKRLEIYPGGVLSLQRHKFRAEHWVIVAGKAEVTIDDTVQVLEPNQSIYVPLGSVHRLANREAESLVLIEVQTGTYFGEDDIERLDDAYNRTTP